MEGGKNQIIYSSLCHICLEEIPSLVKYEDPSIVVHEGPVAKHRGDGRIIYLCEFCNKNLINGQEELTEMIRDKKALVEKNKERKKEIEEFVKELATEKELKRVASEGPGRKGRKGLHSLLNKATFGSWGRKNQIQSSSRTEQKI